MAAPILFKRPNEAGCPNNAPDLSSAAAGCPTANPMITRLAQVHVLPALRSGQAPGKLSPDKCAAHRDQTAEHPDAEDQERRVDAMRHLGRISKNSGAHDAAHHDHRGVEQSKLTARLWSL